MNRNEAIQKFGNPFVTELELQQLELGSGVTTRGMYEMTAECELPDNAGWLRVTYEIPQEMFESSEDLDFDNSVWDNGIYTVE